MQQFVTDGETYSASDEPLRLLGLLRRHMDQTLENSVFLRDEELFALKSWLLTCAEQMANGTAVWLEETSPGSQKRIVAALGKSDEGGTVLWHEPLPWPFGGR